MKTKNLFLIAFIAVLFSSCSSLNYYQVYKAVPESDITLKENQFIFDDKNCSIKYNLWDEGGNIGFMFNNKTNTNIYINLEECFFVYNGIANNYYKNRVYTSSTTIGNTQSVAKSMTGVNSLALIQTNSIYVKAISSNGKSVSTHEEKIICIPANTKKYIYEYSINNTAFRNCDFLRFPKKNQIKTLTFTKSNSPVIYSNRIEYKLGQNGNPIKIENKFFVSEITNYPESEITELKPVEECGKAKYKNQYTTVYRYFKDISPDKFYLKYTKMGTEKY